MLITLAVIGVLAILVSFVRAIGLKRINVEFDNKPPIWRSKGLKRNENPPKQLNK